MTLESQLRRDEGVRTKPYKDSVGKLTIGVGRNLDDVGLTQSEIDLLLANDIANARRQLITAFPWVEGLSEPRLGALINMTFNMGIHGLSGFRKFLGFMQSGDYLLASQEMLDSTWADQVGARSQRLSLQIESDNWQ